jgi:hypothetical protein
LLVIVGVILVAIPYYIRIWGVPKRLSHIKTLSAEKNTCEYIKTLTVYSWSALPNLDTSPIFYIQDLRRVWSGFATLESSNKEKTIEQNLQIVFQKHDARELPFLNEFMRKKIWILF